MKLELGNIHITDLEIGDKTNIKGGKLTIDTKAIKEIVLEDDRLIDLSVEIAKPGDSIRIAPVKDAIEPRVKVKGQGAMFPGVINKVKEVGSGRTHVLKGAAVITCGKIVSFQEGLIDMSGTGAEYTPFSQTHNVCLVLTPKEGIETHEYEAAGRLAGLKVAAYLGEAGKEVEPDEVLVYETKPYLEQVNEFPKLPRVGYVHMLQSQGLLHDTYYYGVDAKKIVPTFMYPTEIMDGAIISGNCVSPCDKVTTYHHQNEPVITDLYKRHGKDINFIGVIITNENVFLMDKERSSDMVSKLTEFLALDGVIISEEGFGNPDTDLMMNCKKVSNRGAKTVLITDEYPGQDGKSESLADGTEEAKYVVTCGNANAVVELPAMKKTIGMLDYIEVMVGGYEGSLRKDGSIEAEIQIITGSTVEIGYSHLTTRGI